MTEGPQQRRYACDDPVVMGVYGPGEKVMSGRTVIRDLQTYHPIQPHTPFFIQRTMGPSGHVGGGVGAAIARAAKSGSFSISTETDSVLRYHAYFVK